MNLYELYEIADENAINVDYFPKRQAVSISIPDSIAIDIDKIETCREEKAVLAHELGHCMTGSFYTISTIDNRGRMEERANRWAIKTLLPFSKLNEAVVSGIYETYDLADYFELPELFIKTALNYYLNCCGLTFNHNSLTKV